LFSVILSLDVAVKIPGGFYYVFRHTIFPGDYLDSDSVLWAARAQGYVIKRSIPGTYGHTLSMN